MKNLLIAAIIFQGVSGIAGGIGLIADPTGESLRIPVEWIRGSPFSNYLIPGIILLLVLGIYPMLISIGLIKSKYWGWLGSSFLGGALIIWIITEILIIGYHAKPPLQLIYGLLGISILILVYSPGVKKYYRSRMQKENEIK